MVFKKKEKIKSIPTYESSSKDNGFSKDIEDDNLPQFDELPSLGIKKSEKSHREDEIESLKHMVTRQNLPEKHSIFERRGFHIPLREKKLQPVISPGEETYAVSKKETYVKIEDYQKIIALIDNIKEKIHEAEQTLILIEKVKNQENAEFDRWKENINKMKDKLIMIDRILSGY